MTRAQRYFLAVAMLLFAWVLHVKTCDWHYKEPVAFARMNPNGMLSTVRDPILVFNDNDPVTGVARVTGVTTNHSVGLGTALAWGVFIPFALVLIDIWWILGWRRSARIDAGCCRHCGYDLQGSPPDATKCPECGAPDLP